MIFFSIDLIWIADANKVKLTHVPGAILFEYVQQKPAQVEYEIGEEKKDSERKSLKSRRTKFYIAIDPQVHIHQKRTEPCKVILST